MIRFVKRLVVAVALAAACFTMPTVAPAGATSPWGCQFDSVRLAYECFQIHGDQGFVQTFTGYYQQDNWHLGWPENVYVRVYGPVNWGRNCCDINRFYFVGTLGLWQGSYWTINVWNTLNSGEYCGYYYGPYWYSPNSPQLCWWVA